jgi:lipoate-protein ligase A
MDDHHLPPGETWRLIIDEPRDGALNMAIDESILQAVAAGAQPPTLRLYRWLSFTLSLGYGQSYDDVRRDLAARHVVRRPTGGRAILHAPYELTYSVALPTAHPLAAGSIVESYRRLSAPLLAAVRALAPEASVQADARVERLANAGPVCFEVPSSYEITANGKKLLGSAQVRRHGGVLQHGALPLDGLPSLICDYLHYADREARVAARARVEARATTVRIAAGRPVRWPEAAEAVRDAFQQAFSLTWQSATPSDEEMAAAQSLRAERYADEAWTRRTARDNVEAGLR